VSDDDPARLAQRAAATARAALLIACVAAALSVLGLFLPINLA
jgi:uncharacterized membrane protein